MKKDLVRLIFRNEDISASAKTLALFVSRYCYSQGEPLTRPTGAELARHCGMARHTAFRALKQLALKQLMIKAEVNGRRVFLFVGAWA